MNILIVEDDLHLAEALKQIVEKESYIVDVVHDGMDGLYYASNNDYDIILLDVMLPKMNGYDVIKMLRKQNVSTPTLMLTAKSEVLDRVAGLDSGADDYLTKPFAPEELLARMRAISRRQGDVVLDTLEIENLVLNFQTQAISFKEKTVSLSNKEFQIMQLLMQNYAHIISKEKIIVKVWGANSNVYDNNVEAYISFLRKKLFYLKADHIINIFTLRQVGYKLDKVQQND